MDFTKYIIENALILIPVLYVLGIILKGFQEIPNKYIPVILMILGILLACLLLGFNVQAILQGILVTGVTVCTNQIVKQYKKDE